MTRIKIYNSITGKPMGIMEKDESHRLAREAFESGNPQPHKHSHLGALLFDADGNLLTSRRDFLADSNADLIDKTIGGHRPENYSEAAALFKIASRELRVPTAIVTKAELESIIINHPELLSRQAFVAEVGYLSDFKSTRVLNDGSSWVERCIQHVFLGVYDSLYKTKPRTSVTPIDKKSLTRIVREKPGMLTQDLKTFFKMYKDEIKALHRNLNLSGSVEETTVEMIEYYTMAGAFVDTTPRKTVHKPIMDGFLAGQPQQYKHKHIGGLLVTDDGGIYVQIRSPEKKENPGMYDKLVGGHIPDGDSPVVAAYHEFIEEMAIAIALFDQSTYLDILKNCPEATKVQAVCKNPIPFINYVSRRERPNGESFDEICDQYLTVGRYNKSFELVDDEAAGVYKFSSRQELKREIENNPNKFTGDLKFMVDKFWDDLIPLDQLIN